MKRSAAFPDRLVREVARECARAQDPLDLLERVAARFRAAVPYASAGWILVDPDTMLMNGVYGEGIDRNTHLALIEAEMSDEEDYTKFAELAAARVPAVALSAATGGELTRSYRWRTIYGPRGYGDELRAAFSSGDATWGHACLTRRADAPAYTAAGSPCSPGSVRIWPTASAPGSPSADRAHRPRARRPRSWCCATTGRWSR